MHQHAILLLWIVTLCTACIGQSDRKMITPGISVSELEEGILVIFQDSQNNYWFGGGTLGVYRYDGKDLLLYHVEDGLCSNKVVGIQEDQSGNIFFDTSDGVCLYDGQRFTTLPITDSPASGTEWKLEPGDLWFRMGWDSNGPYRYDGQSLYHLEFPKTDRGDDFHKRFPNASYTPYGIYTFYQDQQGHLWFGTASLGVCRYDGVSLSWLYEEQLTQTPAGGDFGIRSIIEDRAGYFWFCNTRYRYDILPESIDSHGTSQIHYKKEEGIGYTRENSKMDFPYFMSVAEDKAGDLWMVTYDDGVWRKAEDQLIHYPITDGEKEVLLFSIYKDRQGTLWLGTHNAGVYRYDGSDFVKFKP